MKLLHPLPSAPVPSVKSITPWVISKIHARAMLTPPALSDPSGIIVRVAFLAILSLTYHQQKNKARSPFFWIAHIDGPSGGLRCRMIGILRLTTKSLWSAA